jgi:hypothetical protein
LNNKNNLNTDKKEIYNWDNLFTWNEMILTNDFDLYWNAGFDITENDENHDLQFEYLYKEDDSMPPSIKRAIIKLNTQWLQESLILKLKYNIFNIWGSRYYQIEPTVKPSLFEYKWKSDLIYIEQFTNLWLIIPAYISGSVLYSDEEKTELTYMYNDLSNKLMSKYHFITLYRIWGIIFYANSLQEAKEQRHYMMVAEHIWLLSKYYWIDDILSFDKLNTLSIDNKKEEIMQLIKESCFNWLREIYKQID